jgi:enoyl-[acyl-carrier-protein] reductase (NADH)
MTNTLLPGKNAIVYGAAGGRGPSARVAVLDATDVSINLVNRGDVQQVPLVAMTTDQLGQHHPFLASDLSAAITGTVVNASCGLIAG